MENKVTNKKQELAKVEKNITTSVQNRVEELSNSGKINLPKDYSVGNAMTSAWLTLQGVVDKNKQPALRVCDQASIANALLDMAVLGLNPAKQQGYFIVYGNKLSWFTSYFGNIAAIQRIKGYESLPAATLIYDGDEVELTHDEFGEEHVQEHKTSWENKLKGKITGAYASIKFDGRMRQQVMTMADIKESWSMSKTNKNHSEFTGEFAKRTVLNRLMKNILKTSTDTDLVAETLIKTENEHYDFNNEDVIDSVNEQIEEQTGKESLPFPEADKETGEVAAEEETREETFADPEEPQKEDWMS